MPSSVAPDGILKELSELWVSLGKSPDGDAAAGVLRACSMTLVALTEDSDDVVSLGETLAALMPEHPARAIVVRLRRQEDTPLSARVFAQCWMPFGQRRQICCEQVEITAGAAGMAELAAVILPLCVPDLPVILWFRSGRLMSLPGFSDLAAIAHKVICDSATMPDAQRALADLASVAAQGMPVADLAWTRITRWREMLARVFENREYQGRIRELTAIQVCFGGAVPPPSALYMAAWLAGALGEAGQRVTLKLQRDPNAPDGDVSSVHLSGARAENLHLMLLVKGDGLTVRVGDISNRTVLPRATEYLAMREELGILQRDEIFLRVLSSAARLAVSSENE